MFSIAEHFRVRVKAVHIPGRLNVWADALSRNDFPRFLQVVPEAEVQPVPIPHQLLELLVGGATGLDVTALDGTVRCLYEAGLAKSTQQSYSSGKKRYLECCQKLGSPPMLCYFVAFLQKQGLSHQTAKAYLSAVRHLTDLPRYGGSEYGVHAKAGDSS